MKPASRYKKWLEGGGWQGLDKFILQAGGVSLSEVTGSVALSATSVPQFTACSAQQDRAIRRLMRNLHHHRVNPSYRPFGKRGVAAAIRKAGSSTDQGPDVHTMLHLCHLGPHDLAFQTELFNLSVAGINIPATWKNSFIIPIL